MLASAFAAALAAAQPNLLTIPEPEELYTDVPSVVQVWCQHSAGTAFVADGHIISVAHVTKDNLCGIQGMQVVAHQEQDTDFVTIEGLALRGFRINCEGFKFGEYYFAIGYAKALPRQRVIRLIGTGQKADNGMAVLVGWPTVIPGMSGGPILNIRGEVVGTVNMYSTVEPYSLSVQLKDTQLCANSSAAP